MFYFTCNHRKTFAKHLQMFCKHLQNICECFANICKKKFNFNVNLHKYNMNQSDTWADCSRIDEDESGESAQTNESKFDEHPCWHLQGSISYNRCPLTKGGDDVYSVHVSRRWLVNYADGRSLAYVFERFEISIAALPHCATVMETDCTVSHKQIPNFCPYQWIINVWQLACWSAEIWTRHRPKVWRAAIVREQGSNGSTNISCDE